jgi:mRNA interferase YafQ
MLDFFFTNQFKKDLKLMEKRRKNIDRLFEIMALLIWGEPLPEYCREHKLHGDLEGFWDCHIEGDWVLLYQLDEGEQITFAYTGTHSDYL